ncbi:MAG: ABC transporter transmembrane domain-containing protein [Crocinitomicaceae bacterium]|nr:ABC transporter transmembrane domain-containing protein [Crocinitomicaceae bacterium]
MRNKSEKESSNKAKVSSFFSIFKYMRPYMWTYLIGWVFLVLSSLAGLLFPYLLGKLLGSSSSVNSTKDAISLLSVESINEITIALFLLFAFQSVFSFFRIVLFTNVTENVLKDLRNSAFEKLLLMPMNFYNKNKVGELTSRLSNDITQLQDTLRVTVAEFFRQFFVVFGGAVFLFFISWKLSLIMFATVPVMALVAVIFGRFIRKLSKKTQDFTANANSVIEESLIGISNIKSYTQELFTLNKYKLSVNKIRDLNINIGLWRGVFVSFIIFCLFGTIVFIIWKGLLMTQGANPDLSSQGFYQFILFTIMMGASVGSLPDLYASLQKAAGATENLLDIINSKTEPMLLKGNKKIEIKGQIDFENVSFFYPQRPDIKVLSGVSFSIKPNERIAIVGASGSGKTTISSLLLHFYHEFDGLIKYDGNSIDELDLYHLRSQIAIVPQEVILFSGSIRNNVSFANPNANESDIIFALKQSNAWEFVESFPDGLDTEVGDRGIQLSGGQKQRIAIARALLKNPRILILDEATSSLDSESEKLVQDAMNKLTIGRTSIVIAHRLSTITDSDSILVLKNGKLVEKGTHKSLIKENGYYSKLVYLQDIN